MRRLLAAALLLLTACTPPAVYVQADLATFEAIAPEYQHYVATDVALDADAKARRLRLIDSWRDRINAARGLQ